MKGDRQSHAVKTVINNDGDHIINKVLTEERTAFVLGSFERSTHSLIGCRQFWDVM